MDLDRVCNECGGSNWYEIDNLQQSYPERRKSGQQTTRHVIICKSCDAEGRKYDDGESAAVTWTAALR